MALIRVSAYKGAVYGLGPKGEFSHAPYTFRSKLGRTEDLAEPAEPGGGLPHPVLPGDRLSSWRDLDKRSFPRLTSKHSHLLQSKLGPAITDLGDQPVVVMVHGFLFNPTDATSDEPYKSDNPHSRLYHYQKNDVDEEIRHHTSSWPLGLGFSEADETGASGLCVAFGWQSQPGFATSLIHHFQNFYARAYDLGGETAWNLLTVLHDMNIALPAEKKIDLFCHSLGSRVVVRALATAAKHGRFDLLDRIDRVLILGGAEYVVEARLMLSRLLAITEASAISFYNFVSRENDVLDKLGENFGPRTFGNTNIIGHNGVDVEDPRSTISANWLDLQIDSRQLQTWMLSRGFSVTGDNPDAVWDHWYYFTDRNNMTLFNSILRDRNQWNIDYLRSQNIPNRVSKKWSPFGD